MELVHFGRDGLLRNGRPTRDCNVTRESALSLSLSLSLSLTRTAQTFSIYTLAIPFGSNRLEAINIGERERHSGLGARFLTRLGRQATLSSGFEGP